MSGEMDELEKVFIDEAVEMVQLFDDNVLKLETNPQDTNAINSAFRAVHTLKGGAASMGYSDLEKISHKIEDLLDLVRSGKLKLDKKLVSLLLEGSTLLDAILSNILGEASIDRDKLKEFSSKIETIISNQGEISSEGQIPSVSDSINVRFQVLEDKNINKVDYLLTDVRSEMVNGFKSGKKFFEVIVKFKKDSPFGEIGILQIISILKDACEIIETNPSIEEIYSKFFDEVAFIISSDDIDKVIKRLNISDIVEEVNYSRLTYFEGEGSKEKGVESEAKDETKETSLKSSIIRVDSSKIDKLMNIVGELVVNRSNENENMFFLGEFIDQLYQSYFDVLKPLRDIVSQMTFDSRSLSNLENVSENLQMYISSLNGIISNLEEVSGKLNGLKRRYDELISSIKLFNNISIEIQEEITSLRMVPIKYLFSRLPRLVRELSEQLGKDVELIIKGEETNLDKSVVDELFDPIVHIIRNSIDHGIETREERLAKGKPPSGRIIVEAFNEGNNVIIRVIDDGRGIDFEKIKAKGIEKGILREGVNYDPSYLLSLIFLPGFSTKSEVSNLSGRGVGMDIVKSKIEKMRGNVVVSTGKDKGTVFIIKIPLTIAVMKVFLFEIKDIVFAIPVNSIEEALTVNKEDITTFEGKSVIKIREEVINLFSLRSIYFDDNELNEEVDILIVSYLGKKYAFAIDKFLKEEDIFLRPIDYSLVSPPGIVSATILGNGRVGYVIDIGNLVSYLDKHTKSETKSEVRIS
ncbi:MAG: ATP-binding protein [Brevinematia bacterium]